MSAPIVPVIPAPIAPVVPVPIAPVVPVIPAPVIPVVAVVLIPTIDVIIDSDATFTYTKSAKVGGGIGKIWVKNDFTVRISATVVMIGNNIYKIVDNWDDQSTILPIMKHTLPIGTIITKEDGIDVAIISPLEIILPMNCPVKLNAQTKLQQLDLPIRMILDAQCNCFINFA